MNGGILIFIEIRFGNGIIASVFGQSTPSGVTHRVMPLMGVYIYDGEDSQLALNSLNWALKHR